MQLLNAVLGFAVAMLIFSTMVAAILELVQRWNRVRQQHFQQAIEVFFEDVVWKRLDKELDRLSGGKQAAREDFLEIMTSITGLRQDDPTKKKVDRLSTTEFAARLAKTDAGRRIYARGQAQVETLVTDLVRQFQEVADGSTENFRERAQLRSIWVAVIFAFVVNVDAITLFRSLSTDPALAERLAALGPQAVDQWEAQEKELKLALEDSSINPDGKKAIQDLVEQTKETRDALSEQVSELNALGLPIGWSYFPVCAERTLASEPKGAVGPKDLRCGKLAEVAPLPCNSVTRFGEALCGSVDFIRSRVATAAFFPWLIGTLLAGGLIGLGGPFWFQVYQRLSVALQLLRGLGLGRKAPAKPPSGETTAKQAGQTDTEADTVSQAKDPLDAFVTAAKADALLPRNGAAEDDADAAASKARDAGESYRRLKLQPAGKPT